MKRFSIFLIVLFLFGCEGEITGDVVKEEITDLACPECPVCESKPTVCPECPKCEKCERCERCKECEKCEECEECTDFSEEPVELEFEALRVYKVEDAPVEESIEFDTDGEVDNVELYFTPDCREEPELQIFLNDNEVYDRLAECGEEVKVKLSNFKDANTLRFSSVSSGDYSLDDLKIKKTLRDETFKMVGYNSLDFDESDRDQVDIEKFGEAEIKNFLEYRFDVDDRNDDLRFRFNAPRRDGNVIILLNNDVIFEGRVKSTANIFRLERSDLKNGENEIRIIGIP